MTTKQLLMTTALVTTLLGMPAVVRASVGGSDGFGGSETSRGSSFGNSSGDYGSGTQTGNEGYRSNTQVDQLAMNDRIGPGGSTVTDTYSYNSYFGTRTHLGTTETEQGSIENSFRGLADQRRAAEAEAARQAAAQAARAAAAAQEAMNWAAAEQQAAAQAAADQAARDAAAAQAAAEQAAWAAAQPAPDMGTISAPQLEIAPPSQAKGTIEDPVRPALRALRANIVNDQHGALTQAQRRAARALNFAAGVGMGALAKGNNRLGQVVGRPKDVRLNQVEGAIVGGTLAEGRRYARGGATPFDDYVRNLMEVSNKDFERYQDKLAKDFNDPKRRERFLSETDSIREEQEAKERDARRSDRNGGKSGKGGKDRKGGARDNPDY